MKEITQSEAQAALDAVSDGFTKVLTVQGKPDRLCDIVVYPVRVWDGEFVDWEDVMFIRRDGKVKVYAELN